VRFAFAVKELRGLGGLIPPRSEALPDNRSVGSFAIAAASSGSHVRNPIMRGRVESLILDANGPASIGILMRLVQTFDEFRFDWPVSRQFDLLRHIQRMCARQDMTHDELNSFSRDDVDVPSHQIARDLPIAQQNDRLRNIEPRK
jgi:hypothetical protein